MLKHKVPMEEATCKRKFLHKNDTQVELGAPRKVDTPLSRRTAAAETTPSRKAGADGTAGARQLHIRRAAQVLWTTFTIEKFSSSPHRVLRVGTA